MIIIKKIMKKISILLLILMIFGCSSNNVIENGTDEVLLESGNVEGSVEALNSLSHLDLLGYAEYTVDEIKEMKDLTVDELKKKISTVGDMIQYLRVNEFGKNSKVMGDYKYVWKNYVISINRSPKGVLDLQSKSCGSLSNLARYVLSDDFDEVGYILLAQANEETLMPDGGHVYNYFKKGDKYGTFDFTNSFGFLDDIGSRCYTFDSFEDYGKYYLFGLDYRAVVQVNAKGDHYPIVCEVKSENDINHLTWFFDKQFEKDMIIIKDDIKFVDKYAKDDYEHHPLFEDIGYDFSSVPLEDLNTNPNRNFDIPNNMIVIK